MQIPRAMSDRVTLKNGVQMPVLGFGTFHWQASHEFTYSSIQLAAETGYRMFDTASFYANEGGTGKGLRLSGVPREELFVASKVWNKDQGYESTLEIVAESLDDLGFDYLDLYMIHWPIPFAHDDDWRELNRETWRAMEKLYNEGKIRALGVSNFLPHHLEPLMEYATVPIMVNELEQSVGYYQKEAHEFCMKEGIQTVSYTPLGGVKSERPELEPIAKKYGKTIAQVCLRWLQQLGSVPIPKSYNPERMKENMDIFDFELTAEEVAFICTLEDTKEKHQHPDIDRIDMDRHMKTKV